MQAKALIIKLAAPLEQMKPKHLMANWVMCRQRQTLGDWVSD